MSIGFECQAALGVEVPWTDPSATDWFGEWSVNEHGQGLLRLHDRWESDQLAFRRVRESLEVAGLRLIEGAIVMPVADGVFFHLVPADAPGPGHLVSLLARMEGPELPEFAALSDEQAAEALNAMIDAAIDADMDDHLAKVGLA